LAGAKNGAPGLSNDAPEIQTAGAFPEANVYEDLQAVIFQRR
jgi:hypothetical protein